MTQIPAHKIEEIRNRFDLVEIVSSYVELKKTGQNYKGICPFHPEKTPSFTVSQEKQLFHCFGCQTGGNLFTFIMELEGLSFPETVRFLAKRAGVELGAEPLSPAEQEKIKLRELVIKTNETAKSYYHKMLKETTAGQAAFKYLKQRGLSEQTIDQFELGYAPSGWNALKAELTRCGFDQRLGEKAGLLASKNNNQYYDVFRERVIFPIENSQGEPVGFGGRLLKEGEPRYLNTPETLLFTKGSLLYGLPQALPAIRREKEVIMVEGYLDVILLHQHGLSNAVAPLGTALTGKHVALLRGRIEKIILLFDGDTGGEKAALRSLEILDKEGCQVNVAVLPPGKDPADLVATEGAGFLKSEYVEKAISPLDFRLHVLKKNYDLQKEEDRLSYWKKARVLLAKSPEAVEREAQLKKIAAEINTSLEVLRGDLEKIIQGYPTGNNEVSTKEKKKEVLSSRQLLEKELIACMLHYPSLTSEVWQELSPDDFAQGPYREIARSIYELSRQGKPLETASLLSYFSDEEMHKLIINISFVSRQADETRIKKSLTSCLRKFKIQRWSDERARLTKLLGESEKKEDLNSITEVLKQIQKLDHMIQEMKNWEEESYRTGEGEILNG